MNTAMGRQATLEIPEYQGLMAPVLQALAERGGESDLPQIATDVAARLQLPVALLEEKLPSGNESVFSNRLSWALAYLMSNGQVQLDAHNVYLLTPIGYDALGLEQSDAFAADHATSSPLPEHSGFCEVPQARLGPDKAETSANPPKDQIDPDAERQIRHYFELAYQKQKALLIERVHAQSPEFFESLVIDLLLAMGYGQRREDLARRLGKSGDGGVDGVLLEDELGLNRIYFQAKRYKPAGTVPISAIRDFTGSLESKKASKGLFLTTCSFPKSAEEFAASISKRVVLVDGNRFASLMMRHKVGVKLRAVYELKTIDEDYFAHQPAY